MNNSSQNHWPTALQSLNAASAPTSRARRSRRGFGLVFATIMLFVVFAIGGLVIDLGLMWVTQSRMTTAADSAALEGLRWRDQFPDYLVVSGQSVDQQAYIAAYASANGGDASDPQTIAGARDQARREAAATLTNIIFANNTANNTPTTTRDAQFGAGPQFTQTLGTVGSSSSALNAGEILVPSTQPYKPVLQPNTTGNIEGGDIVAGDYIGASGGATTSTQLDVSHREGYTNPSDQYSRDDFTASDPTVAPAAFSVLVRMRQSRDNIDSPNQIVDGVSSSGPPIPFLFSLGAFLPATESANGYAPRRDGITVRATSIATANPVVYVGMPIPASNVQGVGPIAFTQTFWQGLPAVAVDGTPTAVTISVSNTNANVTVGATIVGQQMTTPAQTLGSTLTTGPVALTSGFQGYFPIVSDANTPNLTGNTFLTGNSLVIGFGWAEIDIDSGTGVVTVKKLCNTGGAIAPRNASADLRLAWSTLGSPVLTTGVYTAVRTANTSLMTPGSGGDPLLAPVLVRSTSN